jgi:hypothetical protein
MSSEELEFYQNRASQNTAIIASQVSFDIVTGYAFTFTEKLLYLAAKHLYKAISAENVTALFMDGQIRAAEGKIIVIKSYVI